MPNLSLLVSLTWCAGRDSSLGHARSLPGMHSCSSPDAEPLLPTEPVSCPADRQEQCQGRFRAADAAAGVHDRCARTADRLLQSSVCLQCLSDDAGLVFLPLRGMAANSRAAVMVKPAAGNPWTDADILNRGVVDFMWNHAVISDKAAGECFTILEAWSKASIYTFLATLLCRCCATELSSQRWHVKPQGVAPSRPCCCADALLDNCNFSHIGPLLQGQAANGALSDTASAKVKLASISAVSGHEVMCVPAFLLTHLLEGDLKSSCVHCCRGAKRVSQPSREAWTTSTSM